jgi:hypothetical protein
MYVYVTGFADRPGLIKIGVAKDVDARMATLSAWHGQPVRLRRYPVGEDYKKVERALHREFKASNVRVTGDGGTEFFDESIRNAVESRLVGGCTEVDVFNIDMKIKDEEQRARRVLRKIVDRKNAYGDFAWKNSFGPETMPFMWVFGAIELGFDRKAALQKLADKLKPANGYTTPSRLEVGIACSTRKTSRLLALHDERTRLKKERNQ